MATKNSIRDKLVLALDFHDPATALEWVERTRHWIGMFKVGSQLFTQTGPTLIWDIVSKGAKVFLDLKFHDIPNTVAVSGEVAVDMGVAIFNVHASGGLEMMKACADAVARRAKERKIPKPLILAVTVLTSLDDDILHSQLGCIGSAQDQVLHLAELAKKAGLDGVVASPREIARLRAAFPVPFKILTPGIRSEDDPPDDQKRTMGASEAIRLGSDFIVLGRTITSHPNSLARLESLHDALTKVVQ